MRLCWRCCEDGVCVLMMLCGWRGVNGVVWMVLQVLHLPRKTRRHQNGSSVARLPLTSLEVLQVQHLPCKMQLMCSKCCTCHAKETEVLQVLHLPRKRD